MDAELHLDPDRLHDHGVRLAAVLDVLVPLPAVDPDALAAAGEQVAAPVGEVLAGIGRLGRELAELVAVLHETALAADAAERRSTRELARAWWDAP